MIIGNFRSLKFQGGGGALRSIAAGLSSQKIFETTFGRHDNAQECDECRSIVSSFKTGGSAFESNQLHCTKKLLYFTFCIRLYSESRLEWPRNFLLKKIKKIMHASNF